MFSAYLGWDLALFGTTAIGLTRYPQQISERSFINVGIDIQLWWVVRLGLSDKVNKFDC
jgi:hypothetical protein